MLYLFSDPEACPKLAEIKSQIPKLLWDASNLNENDIYKIGDPLNLKCPPGLRLSFDNDTFDEWDNEFTIVCSYLETFTIKLDIWLLQKTAFLGRDFLNLSKNLLKMPKFPPFERIFLSGNTVSFRLIESEKP